MPECPSFLQLQARPAKPRSRGVTHVLDSGLTPEGTRAFLGQAGHLVDIVKVGWGIGYIDPALEERVGICAGHDCPVSLGGTLLEVAAAQDRAGELRDWALKVGMTHIEVSNGLRALSASRKHPWSASWPRTSWCSPRPARKRVTTRRPRRSGPRKWPATSTPAPPG